MPQLRSARRGTAAVWLHNSRADHPCNQMAFHVVCLRTILIIQCAPTTRKNMGKTENIREVYSVDLVAGTTRPYFELYSVLFVRSPPSSRPERSFCLGLQAVLIRPPSARLTGVRSGAVFPWPSRRNEIFGMNAFVSHAWRKGARPR